ncbi:MAG TPA: capsid cement protein [Candidatus Omnitrophota bacterium]|nr:capsid cement protein [Candidatus Omnitrophota bacterium]
MTQPMSMAIYTRSVLAVGAVTQRRAVKASGAQATVQGEKVLGIAQYNAPDKGDLALDVLGTAVAEAGAAVAADDDLITDAQGRLIPATGAGGEIVCARALSAASGAGKLLEVLLKP